MSDRKTPELQEHKIPDIEIIDLEIADSEIIDSDTVDSDVINSDIIDSDTVDSDTVDSETVDSDIIDSDIVDSETMDSRRRTIARPKKKPKTDSSGNDLETAFSDPDEPRPNPVLRFLSHINLHIVLAAVSLLVIAVIAYKVVNWGEFVDLDEIFKDGSGEYSDTFDSIIRLIDKNGIPIEPINDDGKTTIVAFGNAPFADDRNAKNNLANMIADKTGATVYNCSVSGSYLASLPYENNYETEAPINAFNFYWMCHLACDNLYDNNYRTALETLGDNAPPEAQEVYDTIKSINFNDVDVITIMYDASDYLAGHPMYSDDDFTDITQFTGNLEAGIQLLQETYPYIRIIVLSPAYAYSDVLDETTGKYISSDIMRYGHDVLSTYVIKQCTSCIRNRVTFVDNLYGTVTAENADACLTDYLHLNVTGREKIADRFIYALNYYND